MSTPIRPPAAARRARLAVSAMFFTNGAIYANVIPRLPEIKASLELSDTLYGLSIAAMPVGALLSGLAAGPLIRRMGSARLATTGTVLLALAMLVIGFAPATAVFALGLFLAGTLDSVIDVAQNAHGLRVQRRYGRSIINGFHAIWSLGSLTGGLMSAAALALGIPLGLHLIVTGVLFAGAALAMLPLSLPGPDEESGEGGAPSAASGRPPRVSPRTVLLLGGLALIAIAATFVEDVGNSWATLYMLEGLEAPGAVAALGFIALAGAQLVGRLCGDVLTDRLGQRTVAVGGGVLLGVGMSVALAVPTVPTTLIGFAAAGFGIATLIPAVMHTADEIPGLRSGTGLTVVTWLMRLGFLVSPLLIGAISDATELRVSLMIVPLLGVVIVALSPLLSRRLPR